MSDPWLGHPEAEGYAVVHTTDPWRPSDWRDRPDDIDVLWSDIVMPLWMAGSSPSASSP